MSGWIQATMQQNTIVMDDPVGWQAHHAQAQAPASLQSFMGHPILPRWVMTIIWWVSELNAQCSFISFELRHPMVGQTIETINFAIWTFLWQWKMQDQSIEELSKFVTILNSLMQHYWEAAVIFYNARSYFWYVFEMANSKLVFL